MATEPRIRRRWDGFYDVSGVAGTYPKDIAIRVARTIKAALDAAEADPTQPYFEPNPGPTFTGGRAPFIYSANELEAESADPPHPTQVTLADGSVVAFDDIAPGESLARTDDAYDDHLDGGAGGGGVSTDLVVPPDRVLTADFWVDSGSLDVTGGGAEGPGRTLTGNSPGTLFNDIAGAPATVGLKVLLTGTNNNSAEAKRRGLYVVTTAGDDETIPFVLTRDTAFDEPADVSGTTFIRVAPDDTENERTFYVEHSPAQNPIVFGTSRFLIYDFSPDLFDGHKDPTTHTPVTRIVANRAHFVGAMTLNGNEIQKAIKQGTSPNDSVVPIGTVGRGDLLIRSATGTDEIHGYSPVHRLYFPPRNLVGVSGAKAVELATGKTGADVDAVRGFGGLVVTSAGTIKSISASMPQVIADGDPEFRPANDVTLTVCTLLHGPTGLSINLGLGTDAEAHVQATDVPNIEAGDLIMVVASIGAGAGAYDVWCSATVNFLPNV